MAVNATKKDENTVLKRKTQTILRLIKYLFAYKKTIAAVLVIIAVSTAITLINPLITERAINVDIANHDYKSLYTLVIFALVMNFILFIAVKLRMYLIAKI